MTLFVILSIKKKHILLRCLLIKKGDSFKPPSYYRTSKLFMNFCMKASEYSVENGSIMTIS